MDETIKLKLYEKNERLINMVIERAKRDFPNDIAVIGLVGSFTTNEYHEKSDLDFIIVNYTDDGWKIATSFIFDDVGYDIYCSSWERISTLTHLQVLYCAKPEYMDKINHLLGKKREELSEPIGENCINRAKKYIDIAKQKYSDLVLAENIGEAKYASGEMLHNLCEGIMNINNVCIVKGLQKLFEELLKLQYLPLDFENNYISLIEAKSINEIQSAAFVLLKSVVNLYSKIREELIAKPTPTFENLRGTYEELWCNYRNKTLRSTSLNDKSYTFLIARGAQNYLDEMTETRGTRKIDIMQYYDADNLEQYKGEFLKAMDEYLYEYEKVGRNVEKYDTFEELYKAFMKI
ncbi:hypothetical protein PAECIP111892_04916 [Paenibacillus auburnensis]|uniref:Polymerase nucleotidyl transferase domain-containing protein n=1 Tax=Paenibacillus auburnensis TaxID=2905649 RepID=A0ABM9CRT9_9BACL|nr:nucleotidyltransferase domain-containing protein [Paenibacillus auburnensis]CAH1220772.1 hypothetical protein PAECIP111892_04916 [Paenibacillus auburnensis]